MTGFGRLQCPKRRGHRVPAVGFAKMTCPKHRGWSAHRDAEQGIKGACTICYAILAAAKAHDQAYQAIRLDSEEPVKGDCPSCAAILAATKVHAQAYQAIRHELDAREEKREKAA